MENKIYSDDELTEIAKSLIEGLRPMHLRVFEIRIVLEKACGLLDCIVLRER